ncbi:hypothetical protein [Staphylococcus haemolyticus]|uniref:hypothetical protein n=1 Tax=Staphylococcus haemolyticus TaxID=1283 RepID=UPI002B240EC0|nr:hypothetical protein [Staphylococcus haemolyticus]MEB2657270.1 hypothetical protein [Staphylococcus haemolyticus]
MADIKDWLVEKNRRQVKTYANDKIAINAAALLGLTMAAKMFRNLHADTETSLDDVIELAIRALEEHTPGIREFIK